MATLIKWHTGTIEGGFSGMQTVDESKQTWNHIAEFDKPPSVDEVYAQRQCPTLFDKLVVNGRTNPNLFLVDRSVEQIKETPQAVRVRLTYSNKMIGEFDGKFKYIPNPLERPALITWGSYVTREAVEIAYDGDDKKVMVTTTAGEPLILEEERRYRTIRVLKNVSQVPDLFAEGDDWINEDDVKIGGHLFKKLTLRLMPIEIGPIQLENNVLFYEIVLNILHNPKTWIRRVRNAGYFMRSFDPTYVRVSGAVAKKIFPIIPIRFGNKTKADRPILLDREGRPLQRIEKGEYVHPGDGQTYKTYEIVSPEDFGRAFTEDELKESIRYFRTISKLNFNNQLGAVLK